MFCKLCWPPKDKCSYFLPLLSSLPKISSKQFHSHNFCPHICNDDFHIHIYLGISNVKSQIFPLELWEKEKMKYLQKLVKEQTFNGVAGKFGILLYLGPEFRLGSLLFLNLNWMDSPISSWNNQRSQASLLCRSCPSGQPGNNNNKKQ